MTRHDAHGAQDRKGGILGPERGRIANVRLANTPPPTKRDNQSYYTHHLSLCFVFFRVYMTGLSSKSQAPMDQTPTKIYVQIARLAGYTKPREQTQGESRKARRGPRRPLLSSAYIHGRATYEKRMNPALELERRCRIHAPPPEDSCRFHQPTPFSPQDRGLRMVSYMLSPAHNFSVHHTTPTKAPSEEVCTHEGGEATLSSFRSTKKKTIKTRCNTAVVQARCELKHTKPLSLTLQPLDSFGLHHR